MLSQRAARLLAEPPLNASLRRVFAGATGTRGGTSQRNRPIDITRDPSHKHFSRIEIVSEELCDDLIAYLAPTLRPYKGCTILDVHPGACLWSRKLHEFLRPQCHILMEPDDLYTKEFIAPLLRKPQSKYRHCKLPFLDPLSRSYLHPYAQALDGARGARGAGTRNVPRLSSSSREYDDPRLRLLDANILMTGNLARAYTKLNPIAIMYRELAAALENTGLHRNGLVRQLWWVPDTFKMRTALCPQVLTGRSSGNIITALAADITQVVGVDTSTKSTIGSRSGATNQRGRNAQLDAENKRQVSARMYAAGMRIPTNRMLLHQESEHKHEESEDGMEQEDVDVDVNVNITLDVEPKNPLTLQYHTMEQVSHAIDDFDAYLDPIRAVSQNGWSKPMMDDLVQAIEYPQCSSAALEHAAHPHLRQAENLNGLGQRKAIYLDTMLRMLNLETHVVVLREQNHDIHPLQTRLAKLDHEIRTKIMKSLPDTCIYLLEDQQLHFSSTFLYDRRKYEPLLAHTSDFWPKSPLALYDITPNTSVDLDLDAIAPRPEVLKLARELSKLLYLYKASPLPMALDRIAPNAAQDLIPKVPALTDPRKGGRLDPKNVVMRMVSEVAFEGLVKAWLEWPFRPDPYELEIATLGDRGSLGPGSGLIEGVKKEG